MALEHEPDTRISAYVDGALSPEEAEAFAARLEAEPELAAEAEVYRALGDALRRDADLAEKAVDFDGFYEGVAARLTPRPATRPAPGRARRLAGAFARLLQRPALTAAAATFLFVVGAGSFYLLRETRTQPVTFQGGPAVIEDLSVDGGGAVVYRTQSNNTVIWLTANKGT